MFSEVLNKLKDIKNSLEAFWKFTKTTKKSVFSTIPSIPVLNTKEEDLLLLSVA